MQRVRTALRGRRGERGASALEFALILPVFTLLILGTVDFGQAIVLYTMAGQAAREGAHAGKFQVTADPNGGMPTISSAQATAIATAARSQTAGLGDQLAVSATAGTDPANGPYVQVVVSGSYQPAAGRLFGISNIPIRGSSKLYLP